MSKRTEAKLPSEQLAGPLAIGNKVTFSKTVGEFDLYQFAGVSGDFSPNHVDELYMSKTSYGHRIAHGVLLVAYMSTCSSRLIEQTGNVPMVSLGYDGIRFLGPVFIGDTVEIVYTVAEHDVDKGRIYSDVTAHNQDAELVTVARHILQAV